MHNIITNSLYIYIYALFIVTTLLSTARLLTNEKHDNDSNNNLVSLNLNDMYDWDLGANSLHTVGGIFMNDICNCT